MNLIERNPWKGLDTYHEGEILYGRDEDIRKLSQSVLGYDDTVLYGRSGIGKSSLLNAGILPAARIAGFVPIYIRLNHGYEGSYYGQIKNAIEESGVTIRSVSPVKDIEHPLLWELFHRNSFVSQDGEPVRLLLIFDQFEEIFTLQQNADFRRQFFYQIGSVLNKIKPDELEDVNAVSTESLLKQESVLKTGLVMKVRKIAKNSTQNFVDDNIIHFVFTLREDFLSDFEYFTSAIPSLKQHRYGLRPINEEQASEIILRPHRGLVSVDVAKLIIEKVTQRSDFELDGIPEIEVDSAVLSLYMNRLYESHQGDEITAELVEEKGGAIIKDFYEKSIEDIDDCQIEYLENTLVNDDNRRENKSLSIVSKAIGQECVNKLIGRCILRKFVLGGDFKVEFIHDILCPVVKERKDQRQLLRKQQAERKKQEEESRRLLEQEELKREKLLKKAKRDKIKNRNRNIFLCSVIFVLLAIGCGCYFLKFHVYSGNYAQYEIRNGEIVGVESSKLSSEDCKHTPLYYCLKHVGLFTHVSVIEIKTSNKKLPKTPRLKVLEIGESDISNEKGVNFNNLLSCVCKVRISEDDNQRIIKEEYVDDRDAVLFELNYSYINANDAWVHLVSNDGQGLIIRDSGVEQARLSWDDEGRMVGVTYYDHKGVCKEIAKGINGYLWDYQNDNVVARYTLNEYAQPTNSSGDEYNVAYTKMTGDSTIVWYEHCMSIKTAGIDDVAEQANGPLGYVKVLQTNGKTYLFAKDKNGIVAELKTKYDKKGNILEELIEGKISPNYPSLYKYTYDENGFLTSKELCSNDGAPFAKTQTDIYRWNWNYDTNGNLNREERVLPSGELAYSKSLTRTKNVLVVETEDITKPIPYVKRVEVSEGKRKIISYFGKNNQKLNAQWCKNSTETDSLLVFHKMTKMVNKNIITETYYKYDEKNNVITPLETNKKGTVYFKKITTKDKNGISIKYRTYDAHGNTLKSMMYFVQNGKIIGRAVCGVDNKPVRCNKWEAEGFCYYKIYINTNNEEKYANIMAVNECGEKSVLYDGKDYWQTEYLNCTGLSFEYKGKEYAISGTYSQMNFVRPRDLSIYSVPYLHILDKQSLLYQLGLRDGDRIVACGQWKFGMSDELLSKYWNKVNVNPIKIKVLRCNNARKYVTIVKTLSFPQQLSLYSEYHELALTNKEYQLMRTNIQ